MRFNARQYAKNLGLYVRGFRWLWTRQVPADKKLVLTEGFGVPTLVPWDYVLDYPRETEIRAVIRYRTGWGPWKFLPVYATTYLLGTLWGVMGVSSLSRIWYERSLIRNTREWRTVRVENGRMVPNPVRSLDDGPRHPFSRFMTRLLDWLPPRGDHGKFTGPAYLWGSRSAWE